MAARSLMLYAIFLACHQGVFCVTYEEELVRHLLNSSIHNPKVRPVRRYKDLLKVKHALEIKQLIKLDEKNQVVTTSALLKVQWQDQYLRWDPKKFYGITGLNINIKHIWFPRIELFNNADDSLDEIAIPSVFVTSDGSVDAVMPRILKSTCSIKVKDFPYDTQVCELSFGSFQYEAKHMMITPLNPYVSLDNFQAHAEWDLKETSVSNNNVRHGFSAHKTFSGVSYQIRLDRKPLYYVYNFIMPCLLIAMITVLLFLIPPQTGERMAVGVTILLSLAVFFLLLEQKMPETSDSVPLIGKYFACTIAEISIAVGVICYVLILHHHDPVEVPAWMRKYILGYMAKALFITTSMNARGKKDANSVTGVTNYVFDEINGEEVANLLAKKYVKLWRKNVALVKEERLKESLLGKEEHRHQECEETTSSKHTLSNSPETMVTEVDDSDEEKEYWDEIEGQFMQPTKNNNVVEKSEDVEDVKEQIDPKDKGHNESSCDNNSAITSNDKDQTGDSMDVKGHDESIGDLKGVHRSSLLFENVEMRMAMLRRRQLSKTITEVDEESETLHESIGKEDSVASIRQSDLVMHDASRPNETEDAQKNYLCPINFPKTLNPPFHQQDEKEERSLRILAENVRQEIGRKEIQDEWKMVAKVVNYFFMWVFIFAVVLTFFICFGPVMVRRENGIW